MTPAFFMGFENVAQAVSTGVPLRGFSFDAYTAAFLSSSAEKAARFFWHPGDETLGRTHYASAFGDFSDRLRDAGLGLEGANADRLPHAMALCTTAKRIGPGALPLPDEADADLALLEVAPPFFSAFAHAARRCELSKLCSKLEVLCGRTESQIVADMTFLTRIGPELLTFYLLLWDLVERTKNR